MIRRANRYIVLTLLARIAVTLVIVAGIAAIPARAAEPAFPVGGRIGLVPPGAMKPSTTIRGFADEGNDASIVILELPANAYGELQMELTPDGVKRRGMTEEKRENLTLKSGAGLLIVSSQESEGHTLRNWILLTTAGNLAALISVRVPDRAQAAYPEASIRAALASVIVRADVPIDEQVQLLPLQFDELSGLRPIRMLGPTSVLLTEGPKDTIDPSEQPLFVVSIARGGPEQSANRNEFARALFVGMSEFKEMRLTGSELLKLRNVPTHEIQADALDAKTSVPMKIVQWVAFGDGAFVRMVGMARADAWLEVFPRFRAVRDGIRPRG